MEALLTPTVESLGCVIWGIEFLNQGKHSKLRLYIDKPIEEDGQTGDEPAPEQSGVTVDDCAAVSRHVSDILDVEEFSSSAYTLEVSSPGMDRILFKPQHYTDSLGEQVDVRLNFPFDGRKKFIGVLTAVEHSNAVVRIEDEEYLLPLENIQRARIVPSFD